MVPTVVFRRLATVTVACRKFRKQGLIFLAVTAAALPLNAQMIPGIRVIGESKELGVDRQSKSKDFTIQEIASSVPANVLWPGDKASFRFRVTNVTGAPLSAKGAIKITRYATSGVPGDFWETVFHPLTDVDSIPVKVNLAPHASTELTIEPKIPETFGGYVFVAELEGHGRAFAASAVRALRPDDGAVQFPGCSLDIKGDTEAVTRFFKRVGVKAARIEIGPFALDDKANAPKWTAFAEMMKILQANDVAVMGTLGAGGFPQPLGCPRPYLEEDGTFRETKSDMAWLPSADGDFEKWVRKVAGEFGWPKGPINAFELWNEPWEGISISGWGADMIRYREIYTAMARGVEKARAEDGVQVLLGGCCSSSNTIDKLFADGSDTFLKWLDFCSIHYQAMAVSPALMPSFVNRKSLNGPVRAWDTESWIANSEDRIGLVVASMHAMGQERAMGVYAGNIYEAQNIVVDGKKDTVVQSWPGAAAMSASTKFVGQRKFRKLLFQNGLPWIFVFDGPPGGSADEGTVVVAGDLSNCYDRDSLLFRTVYGLKNQEIVRALKQQIANLTTDAPETKRKALKAQLAKASALQEGRLTISDCGGLLVLTDFYGNPVAAKNGKITVPLDGYGYYLRTNGAPGSFAKLLDELDHGWIEGYEPVEIIPHDFTAPVSANPPLHLTVTNILNRTVRGKLTARVGNSDSVGASLDVSLAPHETREITTEVMGMKAARDNTYPLQVVFDAGQDGKAIRDEAIHCNVIAKRTILVDGKLDDWQDVLPQTLVGAGMGANLTEKAWLPFNTFEDSVAPGMSTGYVAYDEDNFYFAARISDKTPDPGMVRFENRDDDQYFYPDVSKLIDPASTRVKVDKQVKNPNFLAEPLQQPEGGGRSNTVWQSVAKAFSFDLALMPTETHQVAFYLLSWDDLGRHNVTIKISDPATGKTLDQHEVKEFGKGVYAIYNLSGNVRVEISSNNWLKAVLSGIFFDKPNGATPVSGTSAQFVGMDEKTQGNWRGIYGTDGYEIAGGAKKSPGYGNIAFSTELKKQELTWPEGVRHFSYRKGPDLPAGGPSNHDNVQIAFNVLSADQKPWLQSPPGTPSHWMGYWDTDYEYALNPVAAEYGGGTEIWRLATPGMPHKHFYPRQPSSQFDGPVKNGKLVIRRDGNTRIVEAALPWSEIPEVKKRLDAGQSIKFDFRINDNGGPSYELASERGVSKTNATTFHNDWQTHWSNELEFGFEKRK